MFIAIYKNLQKITAPPPIKKDQKKKNNNSEKNRKAKHKTKTKTKQNTENCCCYDQREYEVIFQNIELSFIPFKGNDTDTGAVFNNNISKGMQNIQ